MDDLSLLLASKEAFLSLSMQKIKTLSQAKDHLKNHQNQKVKSVVDQYDVIEENIFREMNDSSTFVDFNSQKVELNQQDPISFYWQFPSIIQIIGFKGSGKTALALQLCQHFLKINLSKTLKIINCAGGITKKRLDPLKNIDYQYADIFSVEDIQEILTNFKKSNSTGLLFLDGVSNIIMGSAQRVGLGEHLTTLKEKGWCIIVTNLIQGKLQIQEKEIINCQSYFPNIFGSIVDCRLRIDEHQNQQNAFTVQILKNVNNKAYHFMAEMTQNGFLQLILQKLI